MPRAATNKLYRTFSKGLITEAGYLTYPEDASSDELNTVIHRKGNRSRRFGMDYEEGSTSTTLEGFNENSVVMEFFWKAVDDKNAINFVVVQVGNVLHFFNTAIEPFSAGKKAFTVDLTTYKSPTATNDNVKNTPVQMVSGKGYLFVAQEYIDPILVDYDSVADTIAVTKIVIQIRDFDGVNDGLANDEEPTTLTAEHHYNLRNQGWVGSSPGGNAGAGNTGTQTYYDPYTGQPRTYNQYQQVEP